MPRKPPSLAWTGIPLVKEALTRWPQANGATVRTVQVGENATYEVRSPRGRFALRLYRPGRWPADAIQVEHEFMAHLGTKLGVRAPAKGSGRQSLQEIAPGRYAGLFPWLPGRMVGHKIRSVHLRRVGAHLGRMHRAVARFRPSAERVHWDPDTLIGYAGKRIKKTWARLVPKTPVPDLKAGVRAGRALWRRLGLTTALCHADLHWGNLNTQSGEILPFDFDDSGVAPLAYDLAIPVWGTRELDGRKAWNPERPHLAIAPILEGYRETSSESISVEAVELMLWARAHFMVSWILDREEIFEPDYLASRCRSLVEQMHELERRLF